MNNFSKNFDYLMFDDAVECSIQQSLAHINQDIDRKAYLANVRIRRKINTMRVKLIHPADLKIQKSDIVVAIERFREALEQLPKGMTFMTPDYSK